MVAEVAVSWRLRAAVVAEVVTSAARGAACTAAIHRSRCAHQPPPPCSQPIAVPVATRARSRCCPSEIWKPCSVAFTSLSIVIGKSCRCSLMCSAASNWPPGGAVGSSTLVVTTSNGLALAGCSFFSLASW